MTQLTRMLRLLMVLQIAPLADAAQFKLSNHTFTLPEGFTIEAIAGPPLVDRPIAVDFDPQGRLYAADSSGSNEKAEKQLQERSHRIMRLEDTDGDGRFDKSTVFADKMMFPEGTMWFDGSLYVAAPPSIWKLTDTDSDGVADKREEWFQGKTLTGCANDLHGPYLGPDGWIYWCKGAFAKQTHERPGKAPLVTRAAHIFRCRPDGTGLEPVMTGGMDNPVDVAFTPEGERIFTTTFFQQPAGGQRDGLIHAVYGGLYGKVNDVLDDHKKTGDLMPVLTHLGPAAPCGLTRYDSAVFGTEYRDSLFACLFNLHKVTRHVLVPSGATFRTQDSDFLVSDNVDFHPTDVIEDADGSLIVVDTGGWYKICCPTSQLAKPDVLGAIYRIRRKGAPKINDPRGLKLTWHKLKPAELAKLLDDPRPAVREQAIQQLAKRGGDAVTALSDTLKKSRSAQTRRNAVWALTRVTASEARASTRAALTDDDASVRQAAAHSASIWRDDKALNPMLTLLKDPSVAVRRAAAEALGRLGEPSAVMPLLTAVVDASRGRTNDRVLEHSLVYAVIEIGHPTATHAGLRAGDEAIRRASLIALDQMDGGGLKVEAVTPLLTSTNQALKATASWIIGHHPEWGAALSGFFEQRLAAEHLGPGERDELQSQLTRLASDAAIQDLLAKVATSAEFPKGSRVIALGAMAPAALKQVPASWIPALYDNLVVDDDAVLRATLIAVRALPPRHLDEAGFTPALLRVAWETERPADLRLEAMAALPSRQATVDPSLFEFLIASIAPSRPLHERSTAAGVLGRIQLTEDQLMTLMDSIRTAGPMELPKLLAAFERSSNEIIGLMLMANLRQASAVTSLRPDNLRPRLTNFPATVQQQGEELLGMLNLDAPKQKAHLDDLLTSLKNGDVRHGQTVFNSQKAACAACHAIGYLGGTVGPDLTRIGQIRTERDLLEAIIYPSISFVRSYEPMVVATKSGEEHSGVLRRDSPDEVVLATGPETEVRIARSQVIEMRPGTVSVMPGGLDEQLSRQELADLLAFLKATKW